jgi:carbon monoxide dehydrogenase subunit G
MHLEGEFTVAAPRLTVWQAVHDPALLARCVPGCEEAAQIGENSYRAVVKAKVGPISARFTLVVDIVEEEAPDRLRIKAQGEEGSRASMLTAESELALSDDGDGRTRVTWASDVNLSGRLGKYGLGLMKKKAESLSAEFVTAFSRRVETGDVVE